MENPLFDDRQWQFAQRRYQRARDFLRDIIIEEIKERINDHQREFRRIAMVAPDAQSWRDELRLEADAISPADELKMAPAEYDLVLHLGALHRMNDVVGQLVQSRMALVPDGVFMAAFLGGESLAELRFAFHQADADIYNGASPHVAPMIEIKDAGNLISRAGLALPIADNIKQNVRYKSSLALMHDLRDMGLQNPLQARRRNFTKPALFSRLEEIYAQNFACEDGKVYANFELIFLTGYTPSSQQPKPLRPGSITKSFGVDQEA